ncbi:P-loop containing nucleoside triphosphate hydrolase protein [Tirmania nivea]|nr:P-loop containing nucleoside triphosphate hydrolase protein [Tirmania nivea]
MTYCSAPYSNTTLFLHKIVSESHPKAGIIAIDDSRIDLLRFAEYPENGAKAIPNSTEFPGSPFIQYTYMAPGRRVVGEDNLGRLGVSGISWGRFDYEYNNEHFILYITDGFISRRLQFLVHEPKKISDLETTENSKELVKDLILRASYWGQELHNEVWVFDDGYWQKDAALWDGMQKANWDDVILPPNLKSDIRGEIRSFFKNKSTCDDIGIAWKRGIIMHGPPGNGKTISLKAIMKEVYYSFAISPIPTLYVRSLQSVGGQEALRSIFEKARSVAPCMLVLEDLDSLINPENRSYFLNQMDGLDDNNGIFVVGTTNNLDVLDPGFVARPSRFDRKYEFGLPGTGEGGRPTYVEYWRKKLENRPGIQFPESLVTKIVDLTKRFSFADMKEAFVGTLLLIASRQDNGDEEDGEGIFEKLILQQVKILRKQVRNE